MFMRVMERLRLLSPSLAHRLLQLSNNAISTDRRFMELWWQLVREDRTILSIREAYNIYFYLSRALPLGGAVAELGVYKGGGAKLISEFKGDLPLHLFDTFEGMPEADGRTDRHRMGDFSDTTLETVREYLKDYGNCHFHKGTFPAQAREVADDVQFCFVHLDADLYESTLSGLDWFYPRLRRGGTLISHDYNSLSCPGVKKAFDEFFVARPDEVTVLWDTQCMVRKGS